MSLSLGTQMSLFGSSALNTLHDTLFWGELEGDTEASRLPDVPLATTAGTLAIPQTDFHLNCPGFTGE